MPIKMRDVWFHFRNVQKPMLLSLTETQLGMLNQPATFIEALRKPSKGYEDRGNKVLGFNTSDVVTYEYPDMDIPTTDDVEDED